VSRKTVVLVIAAALVLAAIVLAVSAGIIGKGPGKGGKSDKPAVSDGVSPRAQAVTEIPGASQPLEPPGQNQKQDPAKLSAKVEEPQPLRPLHWHVTVREKDEEEKLIKTIEGLGVQTEYRKGGLLVVLSPAAQVRTIRAALAFGSALRDFTPGSAGGTGGGTTAEKGNQEMSIYFDRQFSGAEPSTASLISREHDPDGQSLHWHILLVLPKKDAVLELARLAGGIKEFESRIYAFSLYFPQRWSLWRRSCVRWRGYSPRSTSKR